MPIITCDCGKRHAIPQTEGVVIHDPEGDRLRFDSTLLVLDGGRYRTVVLNVARGSVRDATPEERREAMRAFAVAGGKASAAKLTEQQRSERARKAAMATTSEQRTARARKAGKARHGIREAKG